MEKLSAFAAEWTGSIRLETPRCKRSAFGTTRREALGVTALPIRHSKAVDSQAEVKYFGFLFPGVKAAGERLKWTPEELSEGKEVVTQLCQIVADGAFIATNNFDRDCGFCDYKPICGDPATLSEMTQLKLTNPTNTVLETYKQLRGDTVS